MTVTIEVVPWEQHHERLMAIRTAVFIEEQGIDPEEEWDPEDPQWIHLLANQDGHPVGCVRIKQQIKIGRMAVLKSARGAGIGGRLLKTAIGLIDAAGNTAELGAQLTAMHFYAEHGFLPQGPVFDDAGIPHRLMRLPEDRSRTFQHLDTHAYRFDTPTRLVSIEPEVQQDTMTVPLPRLDAEDAAALLPHLRCLASCAGLTTLVLDIPEGRVTLPIDPPELIQCY